MPSLVFFSYPSLQILGKTQTWVFPIFGFLINLLQKEIVITSEPGMILTWSFDKKLNLSRETKKRQKKKITDDLISEKYDVIAIFLI